MSSIPFTRKLGARPGVQLNPVIDNSERPSLGTANQSFAGVGRFTRGRIDQPTVVTRSTLARLLGKPASPLVNRLNEAMVQLYEALSFGAYQAVIQRLVPDTAELKWVTVADQAVAGDVFDTASDAPDTGIVLAIRHLECFNEGAKFTVLAHRKTEEQIDAVSTTNVALTGTTPLTIGGVSVSNGDRVRLTGQTDPDQNGVYTVSIDTGNYTLDPASETVDVDTDEVTITINDLDGAEVFSATGSLNPAAVNEFGESAYLPSVVSGLSDVVEVVAVADKVSTTAAFYGAALSEDIVYFDEGSTTYQSSDIDAALAKLKAAPVPYGYLCALGTQSTMILSKLFALGADINKQVIWDVPGNLPPAAAITFYNQLNVDSHYSQAYWAPLRGVDPLNGGKDIIGVAGMQVGLRCARNARTNGNGIPPMHYPIAGKDHKVSRVGIVQVHNPSEEELDLLAEAKINPVIFERYNSGSGYVFTDSLTGAKTSGDRKLIAVAEMASQNDDWITAQAKEFLQKPMSVAVRLMSDFMKALLEAEEAAGWLIPSDSLEGRTFIAQVRPNAMRPKDRMDVEYWVSYEGTTRAIHVQQTISR